MYRQSFFVVVLSLLVMGLLATGTKLVAAIPGVTGLPSSYDPKVTVQEAANTSNKPLLIEFYTDACRTCQIVTPWVHDLANNKYKSQVTYVMVNADDQTQAQVAQLFAIEYVPSIFVFDFKHMKKEQISPNAYGSKGTLDRAIGKAIKRVEKRSQS